MTTSLRMISAALLLAVGCVLQSGAVELRVSREVLERTLKQQLFNGPQGRYYIKGNAQSACSVYAEDAKLSFSGDRIAVDMKTHAKLGKQMMGTCVGISLSPASEVSMAPVGEGETLGFRDARVEKVSDQKELNFILAPFLSHQIPSSLKINAADLLRKALEGSTATSGFKVSLVRLKIHSMQIDGNDLVLDIDADLSVK